jgi:CBS-domain-containing membrane protein
MVVRDCMKHKVFSVPSSATVAEAAQDFIRRHVGVLPVVDPQNRPVGILRLADLLTLELPDFVSLVEDVDFVHDFGAVETTRPSSEQLARPVTELMQPIVTVEEDCGLLRCYTIMMKEELQDIPVTDSQRILSGIASRVDVAAAILSGWSQEKAS